MVVFVARLFGEFIPPIGVSVAIPPLRRLCQAVSYGASLVIERGPEIHVSVLAVAVRDIIHDVGASELMATLPIHLSLSPPRTRSHSDTAIGAVIDACHGMASAVILCVADASGYSTAAAIPTIPTSRIARTMNSFRFILNYSTRGI